MGPVTAPRKKAHTTETTRDIQNINNLREDESGSPSMMSAMMNVGQSCKDARIQTTQIFHAKTTTNIGTWNVQTLNQDRQLTQVLSKMEKYSINILGLSKVRWKGIRKIVRDGVTLSQKHMYGVGICIYSHTAGALLAWSPVSDCIITARFQSRYVEVTVLQVYAPTNESSDQIKNDFHNLLQDTINKTPRHDIRLLIGDRLMCRSILSTRLRINYRSVRFTASTNDNGERLKIFCNLNDISIGNTFLKHKCIHKLTWLSPDHLTQNEIDYMSISSRWQSLLQDVHIFRGADCGSDHFLVVAKVKIKFKSLKCAKRQAPDNLNSLKCADIRSSYREEISDRISILSGVEDIE